MFSKLSHEITFLSKSRTNLFQFSVGVNQSFAYSFVYSKPTEKKCHSIFNNNFTLRQKYKTIQQIQTELYINSMVVVVGGGFFLECEDFGRICDNSLPACTFFF